MHDDGGRKQIAHEISSFYFAKGATGMQQETSPCTGLHPLETIRIAPISDPFAISSAYHG
ncbi:MAG: hypothetical protein OEW21_06480 [Betaproteobacteria bacterium]|nr:hypothetical protein [Betaproteobacteria bacterium]